MENGNINLAFVAERFREVVGDEPKAFSYDIGVSLSTLYNYLQGKRVPATEVLYRAAKYTGRPMEWFLVPERGNGGQPSGTSLQR